MADTIDHTTLSRLVEAGAVRAAHVVGQAGGWGVVIRYGMTERALAASRSRDVRLFKKLETVVGYLRGVGLSRFEVDAAGYDPDQVKTYSRPDRAAALKQAHAAAAHDAWFRAELRASLDDPRPSVADAEARQIFAEKKKALRQRISEGR
jgi:hypothetical protein